MNITFIILIISVGAQKKHELVALINLSRSSNQFAICEHRIAAFISVSHILSAYYIEKKKTEV